MPDLREFPVSSGAQIERESLAAKVASLEKQSAELRGRLERMEAGRPARRRRARSTERAGRDERSVSRRHLFGLLGGAAVAGAGLAVVGTAGDPAGATNPNFILDQSNTGTATTDLTADLGYPDATLTVENTGTSGYGVQVTVGNGGSVAVQGSAGTNGVGVMGSPGMTGWGVYANPPGSPNTGGAQLLLNPSPVLAGPPTGGAHQAGELWMDSNAALWQCILSGFSGGTWINLSSPLITIPPARVYDSRFGFLPSTGPKAPITTGSTVSVDVTNNSSGVPATAAAVLGNLTVTNSDGPGFLTVYAQGATQPATSTINLIPGQTVANGFTSQVNTSNSEISVTAGGAGPTDFVVDIVGYYP